MSLAVAPARRLALFDLDKTLVDADTARLFILHEFGRGQASLMRVARVVWWGALYTAGWIDAEDIARRALSWYRGRSVTELRADTAAWAQHDVLPRISRAAKEAVRRHQAAGDCVAIVTAQSQIAAEPVLRALGIEHLVCSTVGVVDGRLTGEVDGPMCFGAGKLERVRRFADEQGLRVEDAAAYSDSITDLPLLAAVAQPVAVNPDVRLRRVARARRWPIEIWSSDERPC